LKPDALAYYWKQEVHRPQPFDAEIYRSTLKNRRLILLGLIFPLPMRSCVRKRVRLHLAFAVGRRQLSSLLQLSKSNSKSGDDQ
jgi:hypothetical protein